MSWSAYNSLPSLSFKPHSQIFIHFIQPSNSWFPPWSAASQLTTLHSVNFIILTFSPYVRTISYYFTYFCLSTGCLCHNIHIFPLSHCTSQCNATGIIKMLHFTALGWTANTYSITTKVLFIPTATLMLSWFFPTTSLTDLFNHFSFLKNTPHIFKCIYHIHILIN